MTARKTLASAGAVAAGLSRVAHAAGTDTIRIGLVGTGGRGTADVTNCAVSAPGVVIRALGDLFKDRVDACYDRLKKTKRLTADQFQVTPERCFSGWDNHKKVIECVDLVLLCEPPGFRPIHMRDAIDAGVHVFAEKPVAVDPVGVRSVIETARVADEKKLAIVAGTQTRHHDGALAAMKRVHDGQIGDLRSGACYFLTGELWHRGSDPAWSEMEYQCRNWYYFTWLSGDHIVEQHVHQHDIMNWAFQSPPVKCIATGGRQLEGHGVSRPGHDHGRGRLVIRAAGPRPLGPGARRPDREPPCREALERGPPGRREQHDRHPRPHGGLHRTRDQLGLGHEGVETRHRPEGVQVRAEPRSAHCGPRRDGLDLRIPGLPTSHVRSTIQGPETERLRVWRGRKTRGLKQQENVCFVNGCVFGFVWRETSGTSAITT